MAISEPYTGTNGTWGTEFSLTNASTTIATQTTDGIYQVFIDANALAGGDVYEVKIYEKARGADTQRVVDSFELVGAQANPIWTMPALVLINGWDFTLKRTAGSDRTITWSVRSVA